MSTDLKTAMAAVGSAITLFRIWILLGVLALIAYNIYALVVDQIMLEQNIKAHYTDNQNTLAQSKLKIRGMVTVSDSFAAEFNKNIDAAISGRYGEDGSKALFQMLTEQNPTLPPTLFAAIQDQLIVDRNEFAARQRLLIDKCRVVETRLEMPVQGLVLSFFNFPRVSLDTHCAPVLAADTQQVFQDKVDTPM